MNCAIEWWIIGALSVALIAAVCILVAAYKAGWKS